MVTPSLPTATDTLPEPLNVMIPEVLGELATLVPSEMLLKERPEKKVP
jgi:hypothetical protein